MPAVAASLILRLASLRDDNAVSTMENAYNKVSKEVLDYFQVSEAKGLSDERVVESRQKHGRNGIFPVTVARG